MTTEKESAYVTMRQLWGGPEDGLEVDVALGNQWIDVPSPSTQTSQRLPGQAGTSRLPMRKARYVWSNVNARFEWKEYVSDLP
jgi:hypothetical protein